MTVITRQLLLGLLAAGTAPGCNRQSSTSVQAPLVIYCAVSMKAALEPTARDYERDHGVPAQIQFGGSGTLLSNIALSGQGDLFLAADESYLEQARARGLLGEEIVLATMRPVLVVPRGNPRLVRTLDDLLRDDVAVALANPEAAAIGKTCQRMFTETRHWERLKPRVRVFKPTVNDVAADVRLGTVDAGVVWDCVAVQMPELEVVPIDVFARAEPTRVGVGVLKSSTQRDAALRFARYLAASDQGAKHFAAAGFTPVQSPRGKE